MRDSRQYNASCMKRGFLFSFLAALLMNATAETVWVNGVNIFDGWTDYEKNNAKGDGDDELCWASSTSSVLNYWQSLYITSSNIPTGENIWNRYKEASQDMGGNFLLATQWWLGGDYAGTTLADNDKEDTSTYINDRACYHLNETTVAIETDINKFAGYYWDTIPSTYDGEAYVNSKACHMKDFLWFSNGSLTGFSAAMIEHLATSPISLGLKSQTGGLAHAITLWGIEYEQGENGAPLITSLWITDSDDYVTQLRQVETNYKTGSNYIYLDAYSSNYKGIYLLGAYGVNIDESDTWALQRIPEPLTTTLGIVALAALCSRRRRS